MPEYFFRGRDRNGELRQGERVADNTEALNNALTFEGITPIEIRLNESSSILAVEDILRQLFRKKINKSELSILMHQLKLLSEAHVPILIGLTLLSQHTKNDRLKEALVGVCNFLQKGQNLSQAMSYFPQVFSPFIISMIEIGEGTGNLTNTFAQIHEYLEFEISSAKKLKETLRYPMMLFLSLIGTVLCINLFVIPTFAKVYSQLNTALPWQTSLLIGMSNFLINDGIYLLVALGIIVFLTARYLRKPKGKLWFHSFILKIPLIGRILRRVILIRFAKTLSIVLESGMSLLSGLHFTEEIVMNESVKIQIKEACDLIERGNSFVLAIAKIEVFSPLEMQMMVVGEQNGKLAPALRYISFFHTNAIDYELKRLHELLGPILVACFSIIILIVSLGVYLPLWNISSVVH